MDEATARAGLAFVVSEYDALVSDMADQPIDPEKVEAAHHRALHVAARWAMLRGLPVNNEQDRAAVIADALDYRATHPEEVMAYLAAHDRKMTGK